MSFHIGLMTCEASLVLLLIDRLAIDESAETPAGREVFLRVF
jgi:hypothetical protein